MEQFKPLIAKVATGASLSREEAEEAFGQILSGESTPAQTGAFLMALRVRGETVAEISGAVAAMRARMLSVNAPAGAIDIVGTGGDGSGSWNVSTLAAMITAACGVPVAKHGNRAASSQSGAADVLNALGVKIGITPEKVAECINASGFGFMLAPTHHPAMRHVGPVRVELGTRTIFNLLGPLANPANVKQLVVGVFSPAWLQPIAETLHSLGCEKAWIVHGNDGLDEISTVSTTEVISLDSGTFKSFTISPEDAGLTRNTAAELKGGDPTKNADALKAVIAGDKNAYRNIAIINAAAALVVAGHAPDLKTGTGLAAKALDSGKVAEVLAKTIASSNA